MQLHRDRDRFEAAGVRRVVIGQGTPAHALDFQARNHVEGLEILVDESRASYDAAGAKVATLSELWGPGVVARGTIGALRTRLPQAARSINSFYENAWALGIREPRDQDC